MKYLSRRLLLIAGVLALSAAGALGAWWWMRPTRWDDPVRPPPLLAAALGEWEAGRRDEALLAARRALKRYRAPAWDTRMRVLVANWLAASGRETQIPEALPRETPPGEPLAAHAELLRAKGLLAGRRFRLAAESAAHAASAPGFPGHDEALRVRAAALEGDGASRDAILLLDRAGSPQLQEMAAQWALRIGDREGARRRLAALAVDAAAGDASERALESLSEGWPDPASRYRASERARVAEAAASWLDSGKPQAALDLLRSTEQPGATPDRFSPEEALAAADALNRLGRSAEALRYTARVRRSGGAASDGATYLEARIAASRGRFEEYRATLAAIARKQGRSRWRLAALADLARLGEGIPSAATREAFRRYLTAAGPLAEASLVWRAAWNAYELGDAHEFERLVRQVPWAPRASVSVRAAALYWSGRLAENRGHKREAQQAFLEIVRRFPSHYYGMLAGRRLGRPDPRVTDRAPRAADPPSKAVARRWLDAARQLDTVDLVDQALDAYRASLDAAGDGILDVALEAADRALFRKADAKAVQLVQAGIGDRDTFSAERLALRHLRLLLPAPGAEMIAEAARPFGLDPRLIAAVALQESAFNPAAVSAAGARGLLQLMPGTGSELAARLGIRDFRTDLLFEPAVNLRLGCAYLKRMLEQTGSVEEALAAYNGGPARAARWSSPETERDPERYVERIPIPETRSYVKRILTYAWLYGIAYPDGLGVRSP